MTIINPLTPVNVNGGLYPNIVPLSIRETPTLTYNVETMILWISETLVPFINDAMNNMSGVLDEEVARLVAEWERLSIELTAKVEEIALTIGDSVAQAQAAKEAAELARDLAEQFASNVQELQDSAVSFLAGDEESQTRATLDNLYASITALTNVQNVLDGRLSDTALTDKVMGIADTKSEVNVSDFGAIGDGVADDTSAIQSAIDSVGEFGKVVFNPGTYKITGTGILVNKGMTLQGSPQRTIIDAKTLAVGESAFTFLGNVQYTGLVFDGFAIIGSSNRNSTCLEIGSAGIGITDFKFSNVRIVDFGTGIRAQYTWCGVFENVRMHLCSVPLYLGSQFNAVTFVACSISAFSDSNRLTNVEGVLFDSLNVVNSPVALHAFNLFQSRAVFTNPYIEFVPRLAVLGSSSENEDAPSVFHTIGGRVTGDIRVNADNVVVNVDSAWYVPQGAGDTPNSQLVISNVAQANRTTNNLRTSPVTKKTGVKVVQEWKAGAWNFANAYGGEGVTSVASGDFITLTSPTAAQGFRTTPLLEVGKQYLLTYRIRKNSATSVLVKMGAAATGEIKTTESGNDFITRYLPFVATDTIFRVQWFGSIDVQYFSIVEGLTPGVMK